METFTPDDSTFHETIELPVDLTDQRTAASVRVGLEAALDNTHFLRGKVPAFSEEVEDVDTTYTGAGSDDWQDVGTGWVVFAGPGQVEIDELLLVSVSAFVGVTGNAGAQSASFRIKTGNWPTEFICERMVTAPNGSELAVPMHLQALVTSNIMGAFAFVLQVKNSSTDVSTYVGQVSYTVQRVSKP